MKELFSSGNLIIYIAYGLMLGVMINIFNKRRRDKNNFITEVSPEEFSQLGNKNQLIDVRSKNEFKSGKIHGARNIPVQDIGSAQNKLFKNKPVYIYCASGKRASRAARILIKQGFTDIVVMKGKFSDYPGKKS